MRSKECNKQPGNQQPANFTLQSVDGATVSLWDYRDRNNVVVFIFDPSQKTDLAGLSLLGLKDQEFADTNTEILAIASNPDNSSIERLKRMGLPFHVLIDDGSTSTAMGIASVPCVLALDRYGVLLLVCSKCDHMEAVFEDVVSELDLIELQCPECGISSW